MELKHYPTQVDREQEKQVNVMCLRKRTWLGCNYLGLRTEKICLFEWPHEAICQYKLQRIWLSSLDYLSQGWGLKGFPT
jgi:hypothetical protein